MILGVLSILFPVLGTFTTVMFVAFLLLFSGIFTALYTYKTHKSEWRGWLKALIFIGVGTYMLFVPVGGVATLGLLFSIYFFMDAFSSFTIAMAHNAKNRLMWLVNAALSVIIATMFVMHWPASSILFIGIVVGFALLTDGISLLVYAKRNEEGRNDGEKS
jgi:uncharacterized membrane protein HdeD (DUF308 family)